MAEQLDKSFVEAMSLGDLAISLVSDSEYWLDEKQRQKLSDAVFAVRDALIKDKTAIFCGITRLVVFTSDIVNQSFRWQREIGWVEEITHEEYGRTGGKTLTWGDGQLETTYTVILLDEIIGLKLVSELYSDIAYGRAVLAHELAHAHDDFRKRNHFGAISPLYNDDWLGIRRAIAHSISGEFFAETIAYKYLQEIGINSQITLTLTFLEQCDMRMEKAFLSYQQDKNIEALWNFAGIRISDALNQLGRGLGCMIAASNIGSRQYDQFIEKLMLAAQPWAVAALAFADELKQVKSAEKWSEEIFTGLEQAVEMVFNQKGLYPKQGDDGLRVNVLSPP